MGADIADEEGSNCAGPHLVHQYAPGDSAIGCGLIVRKTSIAYLGVHEEHILLGIAFKYQTIEHLATLVVRKAGRSKIAHHLVFGNGVGEQFGVTTIKRVSHLLHNQYAEGTLLALGFIQLQDKLGPDR